MDSPQSPLPPFVRCPLPVVQALYASKICSYAQGLALIKGASDANEWGVSLGESARIWKGGCIIRSEMLDRITQAYVEEALYYSVYYSV